eukprot:TRINITY_DN3755_c0_g1_i11.p1 TRINITY_DN3755_c0_g1~~TRINITY_DN3755_c0_g1_i11.p1  ORF type:complete len:632 (+),score=113.56 TRINITY_DN3755_c0_g1_i11:321-2216(+)
MPNLEFAAVKLCRDYKTVFLMNEDVKMVKEYFGHLSSFCILHDFNKRYEIVKLIGKGAHAKVYLCLNQDDEKEYAVKVFNKKIISKNSNSVPSLINEIKIMRMINHENIIKLYQVYETKDSIYLVMELLTGGNLLERMDSAGLPSEKELLLIIYQLLKALTYLHSKGIMHRDLKLMNILFESNHDYSRLKVVDLGLATLVSEKTFIFLKCGTPGYIAPEIFFSSQQKRYNERCDLYSLGILTYIMICGVSPFEGDSYNTIVSKNRAGKVDFDNADLNHSSKDLIALMKKMIQANPVDRITAKSGMLEEIFAEFRLHDKKGFKHFTSDLTSYARSGSAVKDKRQLLKKNIKTLNPNKKSKKDKEQYDISLVMNTPVLMGGVSTVTDSPMLGSRSPSPYTRKNDGEPKSPNSISMSRGKQSSRNDSLVKLAIFNSMTNKRDKSPDISAGKPGLNMNTNIKPPVNKFLRVKSKTGIQAEPHHPPSDILDDQDTGNGVNFNMSKLNSMTLDKHPSIHSSAKVFGKYKTVGETHVKRGAMPQNPNDSLDGHRSPNFPDSEDDDKGSVKQFTDHLKEKRQDKLYYDACLQISAPKIHNTPMIPPNISPNPNSASRSHTIIQQYHAAHPLSCISAVCA